MPDIMNDQQWAREYDNAIFAGPPEPPEFNDYCSECVRFIACPCGCGFGWCEDLQELIDGDTRGECSAGGWRD